MNEQTSTRVQVEINPLTGTFIEIFTKTYRARVFTNDYPERIVGVGFGPTKKKATERARQDSRRRE